MRSALTLSYAATAVALLLLSPGISLSQYTEKWSFTAPGGFVPFVFLDAGNTDGDPAQELLFGYGNGSPSKTFSRLYLFDGVTGMVDWDSGTAHSGICWGESSNATMGWSTGPQLLDVDSDGRDEIVFAVLGIGGGAPFVLRVLASGGSVAAPIVDQAISAPSAQLQTKPNPFNPPSTITFRLQSAGTVELAVYDVSGRKVRTLHNANLDAGEHAVAWDGRDDSGNRVASGVYLYTMLVGGRVVESEKAVLLR